MTDEARCLLCRGAPGEILPGVTNTRFGCPVGCLVGCPGVFYITRRMDCGLIVPPDDSEAMAAAICRLADNAVERRHPGENARRNAEAEWDREDHSLPFRGGFAGDLS